MVFSVQILIKTPVFIKPGVFFPTIFSQNFNFCARLAQNSGLFYPQIYTPAYAVQQIVEFAVQHTVEASTIVCLHNSSTFNHCLFRQ
jgi:hypothetical protein